MGQWVGSVRLVECLGSGGAGDVYLGIDERLKRKVAVKAIRGETRLDDKARARLLREARVLSQLEHPNVCRLYEYVQGEDSDFLVLELVEGRTLQDLLADEAASYDATELAEQIVRALVAAHAMSVVHRDLKPANIMVTEDRRIKVLDFGLARAIHGESDGIQVAQGGQSGAAPELGGRDLTVTQEGAIQGTPRYMSPEQARGERVTAAGDIYSLGLILQELFTGVRPFRDTQDVAALYQKAMWGESPPVEGVGRDLKGLITACKEFNPVERPSAEAVGERLRWIAGASARRVRRAVAAAFAAILVVATVASTIGFVRARRAQLEAEASAEVARQAQAEAEAVASFLEEMLASADPGAMGRDVRVVDVLDGAAERTLSSFGDTPLRQAAVSVTLGRTYRGLGDFASARRQFEQALDIRAEILGPDEDETLEVSHLLGGLARDQGRLEESSDVLRSVLKRRREILGLDAPATLRTQADLSVTLGHRRQFDEATLLAEDVLQRQRTAFGDDAEATLSAEHFLARVYAYTARLDEAEKLAAHVLEAHRETHGPGHPWTLMAVNTLSQILGFQGRTDEAEALVRDLVERATNVFGPEHPKTLEARNNLAVYLEKRREYSQAADILFEVVEVGKRVMEHGHPSTLCSMKSLAWMLDKMGRVKEAEVLLRERYRLASEVYGPLHRITMECRSGLGALLLATGRSREAESIYREVLEVRRDVFGPNHAATLRSLRDLAKSLRAQGRDDEAEAVENERSRAEAEGVTAG